MFPIGTIIITWYKYFYNLFNEQKINYFKKTLEDTCLKINWWLYESKNYCRWINGKVRERIFSICCFTIAEQLSASELVDLLNEYLSEQTEFYYLIKEH